MVIRLHTHGLHLFVRRQDDPQREKPEWQQADEKEDDHCAQLD